MANGKASTAPTSLIILNDDMGFPISAVTAAKYRRPNLDRLATNGLRYSQFYNTALQSVARLPTNRPAPASNRDRHPYLQQWTRRLCQAI